MPIWLGFAQAEPSVPDPNPCALPNPLHYAHAYGAWRTSWYHARIEYTFFSIVT